MSATFANLLLWAVHCFIYTLLGTLVAATWMVAVLLLFNGGPVAVSLAVVAVLGYLSLAAATSLPPGFVPRRVAWLIAIGLAAGSALLLWVKGGLLMDLLITGQLSRAFFEYSPLLCALHYWVCLLFPDQYLQVKRLGGSVMA